MRSPVTKKMNTELGACGPKFKVILGAAFAVIGFFIIVDVWHSFIWNWADRVAHDGVGLYWPRGIVNSLVLIVESSYFVIAAFMLVSVIYGGLPKLRVELKIDMLNSKQ